jgi:cytoskeleton protein RodZ
MGEVVPVPLRTSGGNNPPNCGTGSADIPEGPASVGQDLRNARQRRAKSLADVSSALKILPHYLTALETGSFEDLPTRVYAVGYVRTYAAYLGLDAANFVARFKTELAAAGVPEPVFDPTARREPELPPEEKFYASRDARRPIRLLSWPEMLPQAAGALMLVSALAYSAYHVITAAPQLATPVPSVPPQLAAEAGLPDNPVAQPLATEFPRISHLPKVPTFPRISHLAKVPALREIPLQASSMDLLLPAAVELGAISVEPELPKSTELASALPEHVPVPVRKRLPASLSAQNSAAQSVEVGVTQRVSAPMRLETRHALRLGQHYGMDNKDSRITLRLHGATEVRVGDNRNKVIIDRALDAGDTYRVPNLVGLKLSAPDAGAVEIILDDTTVGFAGKDGVPAREISLDPKGLARLQQGG